MSVRLRAWLNRCRRAWAQALLFRIVFGERDAGGPLLASTRISPSTCIEHPEGLTLGDHVFIGHFNLIEASHGVRIDEGVQITNFVSVLTHSSHRSLRLMGTAYVRGLAEGRPGFVSGPVHIGAWSFIGPHSVIEASTRIGKGSLVESHSRVRGEFPDFAVIAGVPAQVVGDTRETDAPWLARHTEWQAHYDAGAASEGRASPLGAAGERCPSR
jgi:acetyltransferase-like isoleucine patch superfamily enzyme